MSIWHCEVCGMDLLDDDNMCPACGGTPVDEDESESEVKT